MSKTRAVKPPDPFTCEICILAGGLSRRMGRSKARLRLGNRTMLGQIKLMAKATGWPVRIIQRDLLPCLGPVGGIHAALATSRTDAIVFLACDMPFVEADLIEQIIETWRRGSDAVFTKSKSRVGFPFLLSRVDLEVLTSNILEGGCSLQFLAKTLKGTLLRSPQKWKNQLLNVNTPPEWEGAKRLWTERKRSRSQ
jgi:molybdopterin-guanine dinucleotide biosynthesis protein A